MLIFAALQFTDHGPASAIDRIETMSAEIIAIVIVAIGLAGLILNGQRAVAELRREVAALRERMGHLEGLLEGLREAIVGKAA